MKQIFDLYFIHFNFNQPVCYLVRCWFKFGNESTEELEILDSYLKESKTSLLSELRSSNKIDSIINLYDLVVLNKMLDRSLMIDQTGTLWNHIVKIAEMRLVKHLFDIDDIPMGGAWSNLFDKENAITEAIHEVIKEPGANKHVLESILKQFNNRLHNNNNIPIPSTTNAIMSLHIHLDTHLFTGLSQR